MQTYPRWKYSGEQGHPLKGRQAKVVVGDILQAPHSPMSDTSRNPLNTGNRGLSLVPMAKYL